MIPDARISNKRSIVRMSSWSDKAIVCAQVIPDLFVAVKELIENSMDAGSTMIQVFMENHGSSVVEVRDNGTGISRSDGMLLSNFSVTSKITNLKEIDQDSSFGFRGQAIAALILLSESVIISSKIKGHVGWTAHYRMGHLEGVMEEISFPHVNGTSIRISNLFTAIPVRREYFLASTRKNFTKTTQRLVHYAFLPCLTQAENNQKVSPLCEVQFFHNGDLIFSTPENKSILSCLVRLLGDKAAKYMHLVHWDILHDPQKVDRNKSNRLCTVHGVIGVVPSTSAAVHFASVNGRPANLPRLQKVLQRSTHSYYAPLLKNEHKLFVSYALELNMSLNTALDVNLTPDKRNIIFDQEDSLYAQISAKSQELFFQIYGETERQSVSSKTVSFSQNNGLTEKSFSTSLDPIAKRFRSVSDPPSDHKDDESSLYSPIGSEREESENRYELNDKRHEEQSAVGTEWTASSPIPVKKYPITGRALQKYLPEEKSETVDIISITDFREMLIIGQFNRGFIITKLRENLYIIDQHAADEKYKYEQLVDNVHASVGTQRLLKPYSLSRTFHTRHDELVQRKSRIELHRIQFKILPPSKSSNESEDRCMITDVPVRDGKVYNEACVEDMIERVLSSEDNEIFLPQGVEHDFATKACRSAVMIGDALNKEKMKDIVYKMASLRHPWNCPHGRPTIKRLHP